MEFVQTKISQAVAHVTIHRNDGLNALNTQLLEELRDTARHLADLPALAAVIVTGKPVFSSGADLVEASSGMIFNKSAAEIRHLMKLGPDMCRAWEELEAYTIGAIEGHCIGGGAALAATLDYRVLAQSAYYRLPEVALGINMGWQTIPRLVAQIGPARTKQYVIFGRPIAAEQALAWGLCEEIAADGKTVEVAQRIADEIRALPLLPVRMTKQTVNANAYALVQAASFMDRDQCIAAIQAGGFREAMTSFRDRARTNGKDQKSVEPTTRHSEKNQTRERRPS